MTGFMFNILKHGWVLVTQDRGARVLAVGEWWVELPTFKTTGKLIVIMPLGGIKHHSDGAIAYIPGKLSITDVWCLQLLVAHSSSLLDCTRCCLLLIVLHIEKKTVGYDVRYLEGKNGENRGWDQICVRSD